ncbi:haloacid dehalogenase-like hydrolase-like protein [Trypanosoma theileri]|uniref:Haloacid dehalogenase-like hydrolase-like protein n=1 Tax=Trypanosoma theileri TaxID=67003 RepID=A0A1X0P2Q4_9TRYP|nr:haloacid dehalogenase-like hydrolase-like protein [Trypanosoma theileri]ORC90670.1 haloacid dehalogenase-like hydrolase-like protein [Trypanosoma theileri]
MASLPFKMVCLDLDGTLLQPDHTVSEFTRTILQKLVALGVHVVIATGRPYADVRHVTETIRFNALLGNTDHSGVCYTITSNGARIYNDKGRIIVRKNIPETFCRVLYGLEKDDNEVNVNVFRDVVRHNSPPKMERMNTKDNACDNNSVLLEDENEVFLTLNNAENVECEEEWVCRHPAVEEAKLYEKSNFCYRVEQHLELNYPTDNVSEIFFLCYNFQKAMELERRIDMLNSEFERQIREESDKHDIGSAGIVVAPSAAHCLDIVPKNTSKGIAVQDVARRLGLTMNDVIAFGDGLNDVSMLSIVKKGCVMLNANPRLKEMLPHLEIVGSNSEDGVAKKLQEIFCL